jgi:hypothetical protein
MDTIIKALKELVKAIGEAVKPNGSRRRERWDLIAKIIIFLTVLAFVVKVAQPTDFRHVYILLASLVIFFFILRWGNKKAESDRPPGSSHHK